MPLLPPSSSSSSTAASWKAVSSSSDLLFRFFNSPYTVGFHQSLTYLRLKKRYPYKLYCNSYLSTILYATFYKSRTMGIQCPSLPPHHRRSKTSQSGAPPAAAASVATAATSAGGPLTVNHVWELEDEVERLERLEWNRYQREMRRFQSQLREKVSWEQGDETVNDHTHHPNENPHSHSNNETTTEVSEGGASPDGKAMKSDGDGEESLEAVFLYSGGKKRSSSRHPSSSSNNNNNPGDHSPTAPDSGSPHRTEYHQLFHGAGALPDMPVAPRHRRLRLNPATHPRLHAANWSLALYTYWWLGKTSLLYRFVVSESSDVIAGLLYYFFIIPTAGRTMARMVAPFAKSAIGGQLAATGVCEATSPYMVEHFQVLARLLEHHFACQAEEDAEVAEDDALAGEIRDRFRHHRHPDRLTTTTRLIDYGHDEACLDGDGRAESDAGGRRESCGDVRIHSRFVLGTPHPTLADVLLGSVFSSIFLMDDPPAAFLQEHCPYLVHYVERVTGWRGDWLPAEPMEETLEEAERRHAYENAPAAYPDVVPPTLTAVFEMIEEVMPFLLSQVAALRAFMAGPDVLKLPKRTVDGGVWEGCTGQLLPALTPMESLMIVDDNLLTVRSRAYDLELALRAARELCQAAEDRRSKKKRGDHPNHHHNHHHQSTSKGAIKHQTAQSSGGETTPEGAEHDTVNTGTSHHNIAADSAAAAATNNHSSPSATHRVFSSQSDAAANVAAAMAAASNAVAIAPAASSKEELAPSPPAAAAGGGKAGRAGDGRGVDEATHKDEVDEEVDLGPRVMDPDEADFYRAFTKQMQRRQRAVQLSSRLSASTAAAGRMLFPSSTRSTPQLDQPLERKPSLPSSASSEGNASVDGSTSHPPSSTADVKTMTTLPTSASRLERYQSQQSSRLEQVLQRVERYIRDMDCPNYTIATVPYKRRYVSMIIPEHEACKARERRRQEELEELEDDCGVAF